MGISAATPWLLVQEKFQKHLETRTATPRHTDPPPRVILLSKLDPKPTEVHFRGAEPGPGISGRLRPYLADAVTVNPICQEELYNP